MNRFLILTSVLVLAVVLYAPAALACGHGQGKGHGMALCSGKLAKLKLTAAQEKQLADLRLAEKKKAAPARAELEIKRAELKVIWQAENPSRKDILAKKAEMEPIRRRIHEAKVDFRLGLLKILNAEQKKMVRHWFAKGHGHGKGHGGGKGHHECTCGGHGKGHK